MHNSVNGDLIKTTRFLRILDAKILTRVLNLDYTLATTHWPRNIANYVETLSDKHKKSAYQDKRLRLAYIHWPLTDTYLNSANVLASSLISNTL